MLEEFSSWLVVNLIILPNANQQTIPCNRNHRQAMRFMRSPVYIAINLPTDHLQEVVLLLLVLDDNSSSSDDSSRSLHLW